MIHVKHPFIVKLDFSFQSVRKIIKILIQKNFLVFAMEFCPGGDFFTHLKQIKILTEDQARIYFL